MTTLRVAKPHRSNYGDPISFNKGDNLQVGREDDMYPGWIWAITKDGNRGWAPVKLLKIDQSHARAQEDYSARELNTRQGEKLVLLRAMNAWYWVSNSAGDTGWIPESTVIPARS
jgi:hypothetical protein